MYTDSVTSRAHIRSHRPCMDRNSVTTFYNTDYQNYGSASVYIVTPILVTL